MDQLLVCHTLGPQLMKLLGIPEHCTSFELRCAAGEIVTVKCEFHPVRDDGKLNELGMLMADYELVRRSLSGFYDDIFSDAARTSAAEIGFDEWMRRRTDAAHAEYMNRHAAGGIAYGH